MVNIICGPVVGLVATNSANILLEVDETLAVEVVLKNISTGQIVPLTINLTGRTPKVFVFSSLDTQSSYQITVPAITGDTVLGRVRTFPVDVRKLGIGVVSCDRPESVDIDTWEHFYQKASADDIHIVLHLGDNVYMDGEAFADHSIPEMVDNDKIALDENEVNQNNPYIAARRILSGLPKEEWDTKREEIVQLYRDKYRDVFTREHKAKVLANFSNLMILDDHDIRDDFGFSPQDSDPESKEFFLGAIGLQTFHEYQRQLWDPDVFQKADTLTSEFYGIQVGPMKILMIDSRMSRSIYKSRRQPGDESYFGKEQYNAILQNLQPGATTRLCVMSYSLPMLFLKRKIIKLAEKFEGSSDDITLFMTNNHSTEIEPILRAIDCFKRAVGPRGDVLMFAGDLHIGGFTDICRKQHGKDELLCHQITTSAINNRNISLASFAALRGIMNFVDTFGDYSYRHFDWTKETNFALLTTDFGHPDKLVYSVKLVDAEKTELRLNTDPHWDKGLKAVSSSCCRIA